ncbi:MAG: hypothetical protein HY321_20895 [Armatimonadetes bacterium]|nr:hypothetical protein [Armatimonadota bacterium]
MDALLLSIASGHQAVAPALLVVAVMIAGGGILGGLSGLALSRLGIRPAARRAGERDG